AIEGDHAPGRNVEPRPDLPVMGEPGLLQEAHAAGGKLIRVALSPRPVRTHAVPGTIRRVAHRFLLWSPHRASRAGQDLPASKRHASGSSTARLHYALP